eukprot:XP_001700539.1 predicted protein [Chlamydomonas reinhardtii]
MSENEPLLQAFWSEVDSNEISSDTFACATAEQLQQLYPNQLLQFLKHHGVKKLGSARVPASELQRLGLGPRSRTLMLTRGSDTLTLDWKADWGVTPLPEEGSDTGAETDHGNDAVRRALSGSATGAAAHTAPPAVVVARHSRDDQEAGPSRGSGDASSRGKSLWGQLSCSAGAFGLPAVQAIVSYKWGKFAGALLAKQLAAYGLWLGAFTGFMLLFTSDDAAVTDFELLSTWQGRAACVCEALALLGMLPFLLGEITITVLHLGVFTDGPWRLTLAVAVQAVLLAVRLTYFSRVFRSTTFDFMGALQAVAREVGSYLGVLLLLMCGFAAAFYTVFRDDQATEGAFNSLPVSFITMINYAISGASYYMHNFLSSNSPAVAIGLIMVYQAAAAAPPAAPSVGLDGKLQL